MKSCLYALVVLSLVPMATTRAAITKSLPIKPSAPTASWEVTLPHQVTAQLTISIQKAEKVGTVDYQLKKRTNPTRWFDKTVTPQNQDFMWTGELNDVGDTFSGTVSVVNAGEGAPSTTVKVACTWKRTGGGGSGGPGTGTGTGIGGGGPQEIEGLATGTASKTSSSIVITWQFDRTVQVADGTHAIAWTVSVYNPSGDLVPVTFTSLEQDSVSPAVQWAIAPAKTLPTDPLATLSGTVRSATSSTGKLKVTYTGADGSPSVSATPIAFVKCTFTAYARPGGGSSSLYFGHGWWKLSIEPAETVSLLPSDVQEYVNVQRGYGCMDDCPGIIGCTGLGYMMDRNGDANHQHAWSITYDGLVAALIYSRNLRDNPGEYHCTSNNCVTQTRAVGAQAGVPGICGTCHKPADLDSWLASQ